LANCENIDSTPLGGAAIVCVRKGRALEPARLGAEFGCAARIARCCVNATRTVREWTRKRVEKAAKKAKKEPQKTR
jgi:hypothetical protein